MDGVRGIILDSSVLLRSAAADVNGDIGLSPGADYLLRRLRYSNIPTDLLKENHPMRGAFPLRPTQNGLIFLPLNYELPISSQLQLVDAVLHKATDEILAVDMVSSSESSDRVTFTRNLQELQRYVKCQLDCCVIDPFNNILPVLDRLKIQQILIGLAELNIPGGCKIRGPHFLKEYVDHSSLLYKFYALGSKIFYAVKKSIPNADTLLTLFAEEGLKPLHFDSLKSLPVAKTQPNGDEHQIDLELVNRAADWLRRTLDLTIFGFDVVVQEGTGDHVIVDVNYLPSFKEVPDDVAIPSFWNALKEKIVSGKSKRDTVHVRIDKNHYDELQSIYPELISSITLLSALACCLFSCSSKYLTGLLAEMYSPWNQCIYALGTDLSICKSRVVNLGCCKSATYRNWLMFSSPKSLNLFSSGRTIFPRSGLSLLLSSEHYRASLAKAKASSTSDFTPKHACLLIHRIDIAERCSS
ncbi:UNVERIFIED_CONTAM: Inositol 1,3,4-trisphosphate 5/6-kinase 4 [Sesamum indicum]